MNAGFHIVVCGSLVPDPLQTLQPAMNAAGLPELKSEMMLPSVLDPWAGHAPYEAANLAGNTPDSKVWLVSVGPKARLQQLMMTLAQKVPFALVALDGSASGFTDAGSVAQVLGEAIAGIAELDRSRLLLFGGCASASRDAGATMQMVGERLQIRDQFLAVDQLTVESDGTLKILERIEGGQYLESVCEGPPAMIGWATGTLPEPPNNPQVGMMNMRTIMPALQQAQTVQVGAAGIAYTGVDVPQQRRDTRIVKDLPVDEIARELLDWIQG